LLSGNYVLVEVWVESTEGHGVYG